MWWFNRLLGRSTPRDPYTGEQDGNGSEMASLVRNATSDTEAPLRLIRKLQRWPTTRRPFEQIQENIGSTSNDNSRQQYPESSQQQNGADINIRDNLPRFGPYYGPDRENITDSKKSYDHVLTKRPSNVADINMRENLPRFGPYYSPDPANITDSKKKSYDHVLTKRPSTVSLEAMGELYVGEIRKVSEKARESYQLETMSHCSHVKFREMMLKDGCFFLQLALLILGGRVQLDYPTDNIIFGETHWVNGIQTWIESMFFVGNQIPLFVLKKLMAQHFFTEVVAGLNCDPPPTSLWSKRILYELLVASATNEEETQPDDLLHGLHSMVVGPGSPIIMKPSINNDVDLEANTFIETSIRTPAQAVDCNERIFPSATKLTKLSVNIKKLESGGIRGISFQTHYLWFPSLYLPVFPTDGNVEMILKCLRSYEDSQQIGNNRGGEVNSYLLLMSDLIQTSEDVQLLRKKGIIQVPHNFDYDDALPEMLTRVSVATTRLTDEFRILKSGIRDYTAATWTQFRSIVNLTVLVAVLTMIQTVLTILSYWRPRE